MSQDKERNEEIPVPPYVQNHLALIYDARLSSEEKAFLHSLASWCGRRKATYVSEERIAEMLNISRSSAYRLMSSLVKAGRIRVVRRGNGKTALREVVPPEEIYPIEVLHFPYFFLRYGASPEEKSIMRSQAPMTLEVRERVKKWVEDREKKKYDDDWEELNGTEVPKMRPLNDTEGTRGPKNETSEPIRGPKNETSEPIRGPKNETSEPTRGPKNETSHMSEVPEMKPKVDPDPDLVDSVRKEVTSVDDVDVTGPSCELGTAGIPQDMSKGDSAEVGGMPSLSSGEDRTVPSTSTPVVRVQVVDAAVQTAIAKGKAVQAEKLKKVLDRGRRKEAARVAARETPTEVRTQGPEDVVLSGKCAKIAEAEALWKAEMTAKYPTFEHAPWTGREVGQISTLLDKVSGQLVLTVLRYVVRNWEDIEARYLKKNDGCPGLGFAVRFFSSLSLEAQKWNESRGTESVEQEWKRWFKENPGKSPPSELVWRYDQAKQAR
jgi:hypothetical protein